MLILSFKYLVKYIVLIQPNYVILITYVMTKFLLINAFEHLKLLATN